MPIEHTGDKIGPVSFRVYRLAIIACAFVLPIAWMALPADAYDPLWQRFTVSSLFLALGLSSFVIPWVKKNFLQGTYSVLLVFNFWNLHLVFQNNLVTDYLITYLLALVSSAIVFRHFWWMLGFLISILLASVAMYPLLDNPEFDPGNFYASEAIALLLVALANRHMLLEKQQLLLSGERFKVISRASFDFADAGIVVTDLEGHVIQFNQLFLELWGLKRDEMQIGRVRAGEEHLLGQLENPEVLNEGYHEALKDPELELYQELILKDGRFIERHSKPLLQREEPIARIWFYRDVSEMRQEQQNLERKRKELAEQNKLLVRLAGISVKPEKDFESTLEEILEPGMRALKAACVSVWRVGDDQRTLSCIFSRSQGENGTQKGIQIVIPEHKFYFDSLRDRRIMAIPDAESDVHLESFRKYQPEMAMNARMDVPIREKGQCVGLISFQAEGAFRDWTFEEMGFANSLGDLVQLVVESQLRKEAEQKVFRSNAILKSVFERSGLGISVTDGNARLLDYNRTFAEMWGLNKEMLESDDMKGLVGHIIGQILDHPYSAEEAVQLVRNLEPNQFYMLKLADGRLIERYIGELDLGTERSGRIWYYRDITEQRRQSMALRKSEERNRAIVNAVPDLLLLMDEEGRLIDQKIPEDPEFAPLHGRRFKRVNDILPYDLAGKVRRQATMVSDTGAMSVFETQLEFLGSDRDLELRIVPNGESEFLVILRDVTQRKTTERELIQRNFELDSFVYRASHDLKAPLNSLMGLIDILQSESPPPAFVKYLQLMDRSVLKLDTFIRNLTDFSRITRLEIQHQEVNFDELLEEINESLLYMERASSVRKDIELDLKCPLYGDRFHLGIVLSNLISNAIKYQDHSKEESWVKVRIEVSTHEARINVEDNGIGIPKKHQDRLFELFFRASNQSFGSGLGLYITKNAVEKMGGAIVLNSEEGEGTSFSFFIPNHYREPIPQQ